MLLKAIVIWLLLAVLAVATAGLRTGVITPRIGERWGHVVGTVILCLVIFFVAWLSIGWIGPAGARDTLYVGILWVVMTIAFEFLAGHYLFGNSWEKLFADYNIARGRIWVLVLVSTYFAPGLALLLRER